MVEFLVQFLGRIHWEFLCKKKFNLTYTDHKAIIKKLSGGHYIILTRRKRHLSTYLISLGHFILTGRFGYWSHVCMNVDPSETIKRNEIQILESVGKGVVISDFMHVFNCDSVKILKPKMSEYMDFDSCVQGALSNIGKSYDSHFDLTDSNKMSCVELVLSALKKDPKYEQNFHGLIAMIKNEKNLTPQMFDECGAFETILEIKR